MKPFAALDSFRIGRLSAGRLLPAAAWGLAVLVTGWVAADLFWRFNTPPAPALPPPQTAEPRQAAEAIASRHLMGVVPTGPVAATGGQISVLAVVTGTDGHPGWAVLSVDGGPQQGVVEGQDIRPGLSLVRVLADGIELPGAQRVGLSRTAAPGIVESNNPAALGALTQAPDGNINMPVTPGTTMTAPPAQAGGFVGGLNQLQGMNRSGQQPTPAQMYGGDSTDPNAASHSAPIPPGTPVITPSNQ